MPTLTVYGASDDLIETSGINGCDEFGSYGDSPYRGTLCVAAGGKNIEIHCVYSGHWCFAVGPADGDYDEMPEWETRRTWGEQSPYSETLEIDLPAGAELVFIKNDG